MNQSGKYNTCAIKEDINEILPRFSETICGSQEGSIIT